MVTGPFSRTSSCTNSGTSLLSFLLNSSCYLKAGWINLPAFATNSANSGELFKISREFAKSAAEELV